MSEDDKGWLILRGWREMDTRGAERMSNEHLLTVIEHRVEVRGGWGLVAELMKRFVRATEKSSDQDKKVEP